jgi:3-deoxy-D-manno-octulosonic-acid transferase
MQCPVFTGTYMQNSKAIHEELLNQKALQSLSNVEKMVDAISEMHQHPEKRTEQIKRANEVLMKHRGSTDRCVEEMDVILKGFI